MTIEELYTKIYNIKNEELRKELIQSTEIRQLDRKELLFRQDEYDNTLCFLGGGIAIAYEIETSGRTICLKIINQPGDVIVGGLGPIDRYSPVNIEMQDKGDVFCIPMDKIDELIGKYPECTCFYNKILTYEYEKQWQINRMLHFESKEDRYKWFLDQYPGLVNKVNHKTIASFLSMSPVTLSRIRSKISRN